MKRIALLLGIATLIFACNPTETANKEENSSKTETDITFIPLKDLQKKGAEYLDKIIETQGIVDHVCKHGGKKILLVADGADVHVFNDERFDENLMTQEIKVQGTVKEDRIDEAYLLELEGEAINSHSEGEDHEQRQERIINYVNTMRDSLENAEVDHFSEYYLEYISHKEVKE